MSTSSRPWWSSRWAGRGALALAPLGAFVGLVAAVLAYRQVEPALVGYLVGAAGSGAVGALVGGLAGGLRSGRRGTALPRPGRARWVLHTAGAPRA